MRIPGRRSRARLRSATAAVALLVASAGVAPSAYANTGDRLASTRNSIDDLAQAWFDAQDAVATIDAQIAHLEHVQAQVERRAARTRAIATARAVEIYKGSSASLVGVLGSASAMDSARRVELVDRANASTDAAFDDLSSLTSDLAARRRELREQRDEQRSLIRRLANQRAALERELDALRVQAQRDADAARRAAARRAAQRESAAAAQAKAAPAAPAETGVAALAETDIAAPAPPVEGSHLHHDDPFLVCTRMRESGGNYAAVNPRGYYGAYQFSRLTWDTTAAHAGRPELIGVVPSVVSIYDQDDLAWALYQWQGTRPWGGSC